MLSKNGKPFYPSRYFKNLKKYPAKACRVCGKQLTPKIRQNGKLESKADFRDRVVCDLTCSAVMRYKRDPVPERPCTACGKPLIRREGEAPSTFARRQTCDEKCRGSRQIMMAKERFSGPRPSRAQESLASQGWPSQGLRTEAVTSNPGTCPVHGDYLYGRPGCPSCVVSRKTPFIPGEGMHLVGPEG